MKKIILTMSAIMIMVASCDTKNGITPDEMPQIPTDNPASETGKQPVYLKINGSGTKALSDNPNEDKINDLQVFIYRTGTDGVEICDSYYHFEGSDDRVIYVDPTHSTDTYRIDVYANHRTFSFGETEFDDWALFSDESADNFQMYGKANGRQAEIIKDNTLSITLTRHCSKVAVKKVTMKWTNSANSLKEFKLTGMYLMDVPGISANHNEIGASAGNTDELWQNRNGHTSSSHDALLYDSIADAEVTEGNPYETDHVFYGFISSDTEYNDSATWKPSGTRLVIEAEFDGKPCFYAIGLGEVIQNTGLEEIRNMEIIFENITVTRPGSEYPYEPLPTESPVNLEVTVQTWQPGFSGNYTIE